MTVACGVMLVMCLYIPVSPSVPEMEGICVTAGAGWGGGAFSEDVPFVTFTYPEFTRMVGGVTVGEVDRMLTSKN